MQELRANFVQMSHLQRENKKQTTDLPLKSLLRKPSLPLTEVDGVTRKGPFYCIIICR